MNHWCTRLVLILVYLKQEHKVSYRCSLPSPLQKGSKDWEVLIRLIHKCEIPLKIGNRASIGHLVFLFGSLLCRLDPLLVPFLLKIGSPLWPLFAQNWVPFVSPLKMDNFQLKYESDELPHLMINMKGEEIPLGSKSIVRSWERKFKNASLKIIGEHVYVHKMFKSVQVELWWGLEMDCPFIWDLRKDLGLTSERYVPHTLSL